jgi:hypothetical protein
VSDEQLVINSIAMTAQRPNRIVVGVEGDGIYVSEDRAKTFTRTSDGLRNVRVSAVVADPLQKIACTRRWHSAAQFPASIHPMMRANRGRS